MTSLPIKPTEGERLWTWRKRHRYSVTQAARALGVPRLDYVHAEHDELQLPEESRPPLRRNVRNKRNLTEGKIFSVTVPSVLALEPTTPELLRLLRRRSQVARDDVAAYLGVSHVTYLKLERGADPLVMALWGEDASV